MCGENVSCVAKYTILGALVTWTLSMYCSERKTDISLIVNTILFTIIFVIINNNVTNIL